MLSADVGNSSVHCWYDLARTEEIVDPPEIAQALSLETRYAERWPKDFAGIPYVLIATGLLPALGISVKKYRLRRA